MEMRNFYEYSDKESMNLSHCSDKESMAVSTPPSCINKKLDIFPPVSNMKVAVVGTGYVGLVTGVTFSHFGNEVVCLDVLSERVDSINQGISPIYEPGLDELMQDALDRGLLRATLDHSDALEGAEAVFVAVPTPMDDRGAMDVSYIESAARSIGETIRGRTDFPVLVVKSTVIPGTTSGVFKRTVEQSSGMRAGEGFGLCMNPEFLREGTAIADAMEPDRIVIGENDTRSGDRIKELYLPWDCPKLRTELSTAEMIKYVANSLLATKIAFSNEIALICEKFGVDVYEVMKGVGLDNRISPNFLNAGCGFGGSCFPKDVNALRYAAREHGVPVHVLDGVLEQNDIQPIHLVDLAQKALGGLHGKRIAVLGLAFKPETDDVRFSRAEPMIRAFLAEGADVIGYDPHAADNFKKFGLDMEYAGSINEALQGAELLVVQSDWQAFRDLTPEQLVEHMKDPVVVDGRRTWDPKVFEGTGVRYYGIGWKEVP